MSIRWKITIEYDGTAYAGFQIQPDIKTVQGEIQRAIKNFCQQDIAITVAGRTDSGVHAYAQIAHFDLDYKKNDGSVREITGHDLCKAINAYLIHEKISIIDAVQVDEEFHARFGAKTKQYKYSILSRPFGPAIEAGRVWWFKKELDIEFMEQGAKYFIGRHDFTSFRDTECQAKSPVRTVDKIWFETEEILNGRLIHMFIEGQSFLHHQVRNIIGTLTLVGEGKWKPEDIQTALEAKERAAGGPTAPPEGLYLMSIHYDEK